MTEVIDIRTRKPVKADIPENATMTQWFNGWKKYCKDYDAKTVAVIGVDAEGVTFYDIMGASELDLLRLQRELRKLSELIDFYLDPVDVEVETE